mmetsp:Transcript_39233/g.73167  ORF Transcript_39233/g.73167 Transcript_39233/m.73167 type:complete len:260 (-) Transcript_39233:84-863(-)
MAALAFISPAAPAGQTQPILSAKVEAPRPSLCQQTWTRLGSKAGGLALAWPVLALCAKSSKKVRAGQLRATPKKEWSEPKISSRKRLPNDPQDITLLDMGSGYTVEEDLRKPRISVSSGPQSFKERWVTKDVEEKKDPKELISEVAAETEGLDEDFLTDLVDMTAVQRADLIDELTRKAFMLMEAGEIAEAKDHLQRASKIAAAFERLSQELQYVIREKQATSPTETQVVMELRKELNNEDFERIFGSEARFARFIGSM